MKLRDKARDARTISALMTRAEEEARGMGDREPGAEHLLLSALELPDGTARRAFGRVGADPDGLRAAVEAQYADALAGIGIEVPAGLQDASVPPPPRGKTFRSSAGARTAFAAAAEMAMAKGSPGLRGAHVVAAVADMEHGTAARALAAMGIDRDALAAAARDEIR